MSDAPKFKTFRDLRSVPSIAVKETPSSTSIPSTASYTSITREPSNTSIAKKTRLIFRLPVTFRKCLIRFQKTLIYFVENQSKSGIICGVFPAAQ